MDLNGDVAADLTLADPAFTARQLRATSVLRWEFATGSAAMLVWNRTQDAGYGVASFAPGPGFRRLFDGPARDVFLAKISVYWQ